MVCRRKVVSTDTSNLGWGALCDGKLAFGPWLKKEGYLHINCLEILAVWLGLRTFLPDLRGHHVLIRSDSMMVMSYINRQGGLSSRRLFTLAEHLLWWAQLNLHSLHLIYCIAHFISLHILLLILFYYLFLFSFSPIFIYILLCYVSLFFLFFVFLILFKFFCTFH